MKNSKRISFISPDKPLKKPFKYPDKNYFVNTGFYFAYKKVLNWGNLKYQQALQKVFISERIVEIPFAIKHLSILPPQASVLDVGCMESPLPLMEAGLGFVVTGYDFREYPYVHPGIKFERGDICSMPFADEAFDAVVCISTIEHLGIGFYEDPDEIDEADIRGIKEIFRVLKKGGRFILSAPIGRKQITTHYRVYDILSFQRLFQGFSILQQKFFINSRSAQDVPNWWKEVTATEIEHIDDTSGSVVAVAMAVVVKK